MAVTLHWLIALLILINICLGLAADSLPETWVRCVIDLHKSIGITVLGLFGARIIWRVTHKPPPFPPTLRSWERIAAHTVHILLYVLMLALPLSGWLHDSAWSQAANHPFKLYGIIPWFRFGFIMDLDPALKEQLHKIFGFVHTSLGYGLDVILGLHVLGALKHQFLDKEPEIQRMLW